MGKYFCNEDLVAEKNFNRLLSYNRGYIMKLVKTMNQTDPQIIEDLHQEGSIGLFQAMERFDPTKGFKFLSFAHHYIKGAMTKYLDKNARTIRIPVHKIYNTAYTPTQVVSWNTSLGSDSDGILGDLVASDEPLPEIDLTPLKMALNELKEKDADLLRMRFGVEPYTQPLNLSQIGIIRGRTKEAIRIKINKLLNVLKENDAITRTYQK